MWSHWCTCFGLQVTSSLGFRASLVCMLCHTYVQKFLSFTSGGTPADLLMASIADEPSWSTYFFKHWQDSNPCHPVWATKARICEKYMVHTARTEMKLQPFCPGDMQPTRDLSLHSQNLITIATFTCLLWSEHAGKRAVSIRLKCFLVDYVITGFTNTQNSRLQAISFIFKIFTSYTIISRTHPL